MESSPYAPISDQCAKALGDKTYDKRKLAAQEIEKMVQEANAIRNFNQVKKIVDVLVKQFLQSRDSNKKKGGLIGLAATSIALGKNSDQFINDLVVPILNCLLDSDTRVRYFASESLYNIVKVARGSVLPLFPDLFQALSRLCTDPDTQVKNGSELLDRILKDIVTENNSNFSLEAFMPLLRDGVYTKNSFVRQFIISWISILNAVPEINMVKYLPEILDGLFQMLDDNSVEIQKMCETLLNHFLKTIKHDKTQADLQSMTNVLINHAQTNVDLIQFTAISWIREFIQLSGPQMLKYASGIFTAILPCLAYDIESKRHIKECAVSVNKLMLDLVRSKEEKSEVLKHLDLSSVMDILKQYLMHRSVTKVAVLKWINHLFIEFHDQMPEHATKLFPVLLGILNDNSDEVVLQTIEVLAQIVRSSNSSVDEFDKAKYTEFLVSLLKLFNEDKQFLDSRGTLIIRQLCVLLNAEYIYCTFAEILSNEEIVNIKFASAMVRTLNNILLTTSELFDLRNLLRNITDPKSAKLFQCLYKCWAHCPVSTLSICLLAQCYQHVSDLVIIFGNLEITVDFLVEVDKLVQLIESPIFASLRLTLVSNTNPVDAQHLAHALFGILMLLPQTDAFHLLKNRLQCIPNYQRIQINQERYSEKSLETLSGIDFKSLLDYFVQVQENHHKQKLTQRRNNIKLWDN